MTIDNCTGGSGGEEEASPSNEVGASTHRCHDFKEEVPVDGVVGLPEVEEDESSGGGEVGAKGAVEAEGFRKELKEGDIVPHKATRKKGSLLWADGSRKDRPESSSQELGKEAIVGVKEGDGAIASRVSIIPRLEKGADRTLEEAVWYSVCGPNCCEDSSKER